MRNELFQNEIGNLIQSKAIVITKWDNLQSISKWGSTLLWHYGEWTPMFTERAICDLRVEFCNMMEWISKGFFRKISIFIKAHTIYDAFTLTGHVILRVAHDMN